MRKELIVLDLRLFEEGDGPVINTTGSAGLSAEMKTFYDKQLIREAGPELVHDQFAQTRNIPKNGGKKIEFRKYEQLPKSISPLTDGVTPEGQDLTVTSISA